MNQSSLKLWLFPILPRELIFWIKLALEIQVSGRRSRHCWPLTLPVTHSIDHRPILPPQNYPTRVRHLLKLATESGRTD